jgi:CheY-like chemotaxis protein/predicted regulator of Ras-like GTPase activity (Roadblock/LC7/MglB family)
VERALAGRRIEAVTVASGVEALERIEREAPDVVVCDVVMPDRDGWDICEFVKGHARLGGTPVLLMTGVVDDTVRARARELGAVDILPKPFGAEDLLRRLEELIPGAATADAAPAPPEGPDSRDVGLTPFTRIEGVQWAVLADHEGFVLDAAAATGIGLDMVAALGANVARAATALGRELRRGGLVGAMLEYEAGLVVIHAVGATAVLALGVSEPGALGKVRYAVKKALPELVRAV